MQIALLILIVFLAGVLFYLLYSQKATFAYFRTTHKEFFNNSTEFFLNNDEKGVITIDRNMIIVEEEEYSLVEENGNPPEAELVVVDNKLISVKVNLISGEKTYFITPTNNNFSFSLAKNNTKRTDNTNYCYFLL